MSLNILKNLSLQKISKGTNRMVSTVCDWRELHVKKKKDSILQCTCFHLRIWILWWQCVLIRVLCKEWVPYFLDYSAPMFSLRPRIDRALCPVLWVILCALEYEYTVQHNVNERSFTYCKLNWRSLPTLCITLLSVQCCNWN